MPEETGPWWVQDKETGHKFVAHVLGEHLEVLADESPYTAGGDYREAEPNTGSASATKSRKEAAK